MPNGTTAPGKVWPSPPVPMNGSTASKPLRAPAGAAIAEPAIIEAHRSGQALRQTRIRRAREERVFIGFGSGVGWIWIVTMSATLPLRRGRHMLRCKMRRVRRRGRMSRIGSIQTHHEVAAMSASPRRRVTLTDIAKACELSRATVSLVLRGSPLVHADTRARVEAELKRQGYVYHRGAANLRRNVSSAVALVINDLSNP